MAPLTVKIKAPNGREFDQPTGLFINNEWVDSTDSGKLETVNPAYVVPEVPASGTILYMS